MSEERRVVGEMLTGGFDAAWSPSESYESREGDVHEPLRGNGPAFTNTMMTVTGEDIARGFVMSRVGTNVSAAIRVNSFGRVDPIVHLGDGTLVQGVCFAPLNGALGIVRESRWELLPDISRPCQVWYGQTQEGSFAVTWRNVLFNRVL